VSTPNTLLIDEDIKRDNTATARGTFATWTCSATLPKGNVLLIPGFTGSKEDFITLLPLLAQAGWNAVTYDQRGQFETPAHAADDFSMAGLAADLITLTRHLFDDEQPVHLVGHSFGGLVATHAAIERPELWADLVLMCSGPGALDGEARADLLDAAESILRDGLEENYRAKTERDRARGVVPADAHIEEFLHRRFVTNSPGSLAAIARHLATAPDRTAELAGLGLRVAVMRGEHDDAWPHAAQQRMASVLGTDVCVIEHAAHSPAVEQPESTGDALVDFWLS
jgi:pimeloyl-ACP methyl ester carboxylesterase